MLFSVRKVDIFVLSIIKSFRKFHMGIKHSYFQDHWDLCTIIMDIFVLYIIFRLHS